MSSTGEVIGLWIYCFVFVRGCLVSIIFILSSPAPRGALF